MINTSHDYRDEKLSITGTSSLPESIQRFYFTDNNTLDTFHLLTNTSSPKYNNTSQFHISSALNQSPSSSKKEARGLQQVPQRFSKFIIQQSTSPDQDNISVASSYIRDIDSMLKFRNPNTEIQGLKEDISLLNLSNDSVSQNNSKGSQATIFSTRQEQENLKSFGSKNKSKSKSETIQRNTSSLKRSKAVKNKLGSKFYRFQLKLKKILKKIRSFKFQFKASSKRTASISSSRKSIKNKSKNKNKLNVIKKVNQVSAPVNNPKLGEDKVEFIENLEDAQALAGKVHDNNPNSKINVPTNIDPAPQFGGPIIPKSNQEVGSETESVAPIPPPHAQSLGSNTNLDKNVEKETLIKLWRSYLSLIIQKRIQLRHEINLFQSLMVNQDKKKFITDMSTISSYTKSSICPSEVNDINSKLTYSNYGSESDGDEEPIIDDFRQEFNKNYQNRKSILGDMLEYESDDCLTIASLSTLLDSHNPSHFGSMYQRNRYGTIRSRRSATTSINSRKL